MYCELNKYTILNINFDRNLDFKKKVDFIIELLYSQIKDRIVSIFEIDPKKDSIIYDLGLPYGESKNISNRYLYLLNIQLTKNSLRQVVEDESFCLGYIAIIVGLLEESKINEILILPIDSLYKSGLKIYSMDRDSLSLYISNSKINDIDEELIRMIT